MKISPEFSDLFLIDIDRTYIFKQQITLLLEMELKRMSQGFEC